MNILETLIINAILGTFPILAYEYFIVYTQNMKKEKINILLSLALFLSLYLTMTFKRYIPLDYQFISIIIPVVIAYLKNKPKDAIIISIVVAEYIIRELNYDLIITVSLFLILYLSHKYYGKTNKTRNFLANLFFITISITFITNEINRVFNNKNIIDTIIGIIILYIIIKTINKSLEMAKDIINLHSNLKSFEKEKQIKDSLFKITHEIKNPIAVIKGYLDMFNVQNQEKSEKYIGIMKAEVERTLNLLTDFSEFSKIKIEKKKEDLNLLIDDIKDVLIPFFNSKNIGFFFEIEENLLIDIDYARMKQVILNIIKNAVEACTPNEGQVSTTAFKDSDSLYIYVKDNGTGMDKETLDNMLVPFYTTKEKGTGVGVSLSKEIIEAHGGNLSYTSSLGNGTICKITLPLKN
jgi:two-component system sporulation sensor kinase B